MHLKFRLLNDQSILFFFLIYSLLIFQPLIFGFKSGNMPNACLVCEVFTAFVLTLIHQWVMPYRWLRYLYRFLLIAVLGFLNLVGFYTLNFLYSDVNEDVAMLIMDSNPNESREFLSIYFDKCFTTTGLLTIGGFAVIILVYCTLVRKKIKVPRFSEYVLLLAAIVSLSATIFLRVKHGDSRTDSSFQKIAAFILVEPAPDLHLYYTHPQLTYQKEALPDNVVVIIGESLSKGHCSMYGYDKPTTPLLDSLQQAGALTAFQHTVAPASGTAISFKYFMSDYSHRNENNRNWYESTTITEIFQTLGYHSYWVSNQNKGGYHDNVPTKFADLCDSTVFLANPVSSVFANTYDEVVLPTLQSWVAENKGQKNLYYIHLMGSHPLFKVRYPDEYEYFTSEGYQDHEEQQRTGLAEYDNSVRYNDHVVAQIMEKFAQEEALVVYFSDHGLDLYETNPDYAGHATNDVESEKVAVQIPFLIYTSERFQKLHPAMMERISHSKEAAYDNDDLMYLLMDLVGAKFTDNDSVRAHSPLVVDTVAKTTWE